MKKQRERERDKEGKREAEDEVGLKISENHAMSCLTSKLTSGKLWSPEEYKNYVIFYCVCDVMMCLI